MARRRAAAQDARAALQGEGQGGFEIVGEVKGAEMVGWAVRRPVRRAAGPAARRRLSRTRSPTVVDAAELGAGDVGAATPHRVVAWDDVGETEGTGIVHIAPGCGKEDFQLGKEQGLPPVAPLDDAGHLPRPASASWTGKSAVDPATADWILDNLQAEGPCCSPSRSTRTATRTAGAARRSCSSASSTSGSST